jgi:chitin synthase
MVSLFAHSLVCLINSCFRGTKGDNGAAKDLGGAKKIKGEGGKEMMEVELPSAREDVDQLWSAARQSLRTKPVEEKQHRDAATKQADHDRNSRTNVVIAWVGTNMCV